MFSHGWMDGVMDGQIDGQTVWQKGKSYRSSAPKNMFECIILFCVCVCKSERKWFSLAKFFTLLFVNYPRFTIEMEAMLPYRHAMSHPVQAWHALHNYISWSNLTLLDIKLRQCFYCSDVKLCTAFFNLTLLWHKTLQSFSKPFPARYEMLIISYPAPQWHLCYDSDVEQLIEMFW